MKLAFLSENVYSNTSGAILCKKSGQSTSIFTEIVKSNFDRNFNFLKYLPWLRKNENIQNIQINTMLYELAYRPLLVKCYDIKKVKSPG